MSGVRTFLTVALFLCCLITGTGLSVASEGFEKNLRLRPGQSFSFSPPEGLSGSVIEVCCEAAGSKRARSPEKCNWRIQWADASGRTVMRASVSWGNTSWGDQFDRRFLLVQVDSVTSSGESVELLSVPVFKDVNLYGGANTLVAEVCNGRIVFSVGSEALNYVGEVVFPAGAEIVLIDGNRELTVDYIAWRADADPADMLLSGMTQEEIDRYLAGITFTVDSPIGYWEFLDRDTDSRYAELGGRYKLAVIPSKLLPQGETYSRSAYAVLLISGEMVNGSRWKPMMIKGCLEESQFDRHYGLTWIDAMMKPVENETSADLSDDGAILTLNFPLMKSKIRFARMQ